MWGKNKTSKKKNTKNWETPASLTYRRQDRVTELTPQAQAFPLCVKVIITVYTSTLVVYYFIYCLLCFMKVLQNLTD